jgi:hypothetical protein
MQVDFFPTLFFGFFHNRTGSVLNWKDSAYNVNLLEQSACKLDTSTLRVDRRESGNSWFKKLVVQRLNEHLCFLSSSVVAESFVLRNRQLLKKKHTLCVILLTHCVTD